MKYVCDYSLDSPIAHVICKELGYKTYVSYTGNQLCPGLDSYNGNSIEDEFWIGNISC